MRYGKILALAALGVLLLNSPLAALAAEDGLAEFGAYESKGFAGGVFISAICDIFGLVGGSLGAMMTSAAIVTGLVGAAGGGYSSMRSALVVAASCFTITSCVSLYFGTFTCQ